MSARSVEVRLVDWFRSRGIELDPTRTREEDPRVAVAAAAGDGWSQTYEHNGKFLNLTELAEAIAAGEFDG